MKTSVVVAIVIVIACILQISVDYIVAKHPINIAAQKDTATLPLHWYIEDNDTVKSLPTPTMQLVNGNDNKTYTRQYQRGKWGAWHSINDTISQHITWTQVSNSGGYVVEYKTDTVRPIKWIGQADTLIDLGPASKTNK